MELLKTDKAKYKEYEDVLLERDQVKKEAGQIWTAYIKKFGQLICDIYEEKVACIKCKKTIEFYQNAINHGKAVDMGEVQSFLDAQMAEYYAKLKEMLDGRKRCEEAGESSAYEVERSKTLYRRIAKLLHPDINPQTDRNAVLMELWQRTMTAYHANDIKELSELEVLIRKALRELGGDGMQIDIPDIEDRIDEIKREIAEIRSTEPYTYRKFIDDTMVEGLKRQELQTELDIFRTYHNELETVIEEMLTEGGLTIKWELN